MTSGGAGQNALRSVRLQVGARGRGPPSTGNLTRFRVITDLVITDLVITDLVITDLVMSSWSSLLHQPG